MVSTNISLIQMSNFAYFQGKDGAVLSVVITDLIDCIDAIAIFYGITGIIPGNDPGQSEDFINIAAFSNRDECMVYAISLANRRNIPLDDITVI